MANTSVSSKNTDAIPWGKLLSRKEVWAIIVCHFCHNWGTFILLTWMPTYYNQVGTDARARAPRGGGGGCGYLPSICHMDVYLHKPASAALLGRGRGEATRMGSGRWPCLDFCHNLSQL
jgi:hypothetical protein